jgi:biopolymer transport protein ExbB
VAPPTLLMSVVKQLQGHGVSNEMLNSLATDSPLGQIFAAGLRNVKSSREVMKEAIEEAGRAVTHDLERFLTSLGTIAAIAPLLGLLGTVIGMVEIFGSQTPTGSNPAVLAHGISVALYNTAFGLIVAIPAMIFYRFFRARVDNLAIEMEQQAIKLVEVVHGERH